MECQTTNLNWWPQDFWTINPYEPSINPQYKKPMVSNPSNPAWNQRSRHLAWGDGFSEGVVSSLPRCHGPGKNKINIPSRELTFFSQKWHFESMIFQFFQTSPGIFLFQKVGYVNSLEGISYMQQKSDYCRTCFGMIQFHQHGWLWFDARTC